MRAGAAGRHLPRLPVAVAVAVVEALRGRASPRWSPVWEGGAGGGGVGTKGVNPSRVPSGMILRSISTSSMSSESDIVFVAKGVSPFVDVSDVNDVGDGR